MTWLLLGQNDHHIHHLLPHLPWHRYRHVWSLANGALHREELAERGLFRGYHEQTLTKAQTVWDVVISEKEHVADDICALTFEALPHKPCLRFAQGRTSMFIYRVARYVNIHFAETRPIELNTESQ